MSNVERHGDERIEPTDPVHALTSDVNVPPPAKRFPVVSDFDGDRSVDIWRGLTHMVHWQIQDIPKDAAADPTVRIRLAAIARLVLDIVTMEEVEALEVEVYAYGRTPLTSGPELEDAPVAQLPSADTG